MKTFFQKFCETIHLFFKMSLSVPENDSEPRKEENV